MRGGALAQLVEQWTENPCVPGSIPGGTTKLARDSSIMINGFFFTQKRPKTMNYKPSQ